MSLIHGRRPAAIAATVFVLVGWFGASADAASKTVVKSNTTSIVMTSSGAASPYPSTINVGNRNTRIRDVNVTLNNLSHTVADEVEVLLVAPGGRRALIMSDVGGGPASNVTLTLDDEAAAPLPDAGPLVTGTFRPTDAKDASDPPAPAPPAYPSALSTFDGKRPTGQWRLFVFDDAPGDSGQFQGGWTLRLRLKIL